MQMQMLPEWRKTASPGISLSSAMTRAGVPIQAAPARGEAVRINPDLTRILLPSALPQWRSRRVAYYDPQMVEWVLANALMGDLDGQWELFDLMEDTWPRLAKNLGEIKRAVAAMKWVIRPWSEDDAPPTPEADERAKLVSHVIWRMTPQPEADERDFAGIVADLLDAWGKGLSVVELVWDQRASARHGIYTALRSGIWVPPKHYALDEDGRLGLRVDNTSAPGITMGQVRTDPFDNYPDKFLVAVAKGRTAHFACAAMLRPLAWWWAAGNFSASWLLNYAQLFGVPMRWANYDPASSETTITRIGEKLADMGSAGWAAFPTGSSLTIHEGTKTAGTSPQDGVLDRADKYCDLLVLGQTLTSDPADRGTQALGTVHERVRGDVLQAAADWVATVLTQQLAPSIVELNYGDLEAVPEFVAEPERQKDELANAQRDQVLLSSGIEMPKKWFYERHDIPLPAAGEETIGGRQSAYWQTPYGAQDGDENPKGSKTTQDGPEGSGGVMTPPDSRSFAAQSWPRLRIDSGRTWGGRAGDPAAKVASRKAPAIGKAYQGAMAPFRQAIMASKSPEEAIARVQMLYADWSPQHVARLVEEAFQIDAAHGTVDGQA